jgi:hypothetical protein
LALGKSVREVEEFGGGELAEWEMFWQLEPWGPHRDNIHTGLICALLANVHRRKGSSEFTFEDFMLRDRETQQRVETERTLAWFRSVAKK